MKKRVLLIALLAGVIILCAGCGSPKFDLNDYTEVKISGYEGHGYASINFSEEKLKNEILREIMEEGEDRSILKIQLESLLHNAIKYNVSQGKDLSNGDTVSVTWDVNLDEVEEKYDISFTYDDIEQTVEGLKKIDTYDAFEGLQIKEDGLDGSGTITLDDSKVKIKGIVYSADKTNDLSNGDQITISMTTPDNTPVMDYCAKQGAIPEKESMTYTVNNLGSYVNDVSQISETELKTLQQETKDKIKADFARESSKNESIKSIEYVGLYAQHAKHDGEFYMSKLYVINKVTAKNKDGKTVYYHYCKYNNPIVYKDGTNSIDYSDPETPKGSYFWGNVSGAVVQSKKKNYYYCGYKSPKAFEKDILAKEVDQYTYTTTIK